MARPYFVTHHQPFNYFARLRAPARLDPRALPEGLHGHGGRYRQGAPLPQVAFYKPQGKRSTNTLVTPTSLSGDQHIAKTRRQKSRRAPLWASTAIIITYDENGGLLGPRAAAPGRSLGTPGTAHTDDHHFPRWPGAATSITTPYDTTSILKLITLRFGLVPLPGRSAPAPAISRGRIPVAAPRAGPAHRKALILPTPSSKRGLAAVPRGVWVLGLVSMCMDLSSEARPFACCRSTWRTALGASVFVIGIIEGVRGSAGADRQSSFPASFSDVFRKAQARWCCFGYGLAAVSKFAFSAGAHAGLDRRARVFADRVGKGNTRARPATR